MSPSARTPLLSNDDWDEVADRLSVVQRVKRLVVGVPHHKTGEERATAVAEARAKGGAKK